jgi:hypothetical protein
VPAVVGQITKGAVFAALVGLADVGNSNWAATGAPGVGDDSADGYIVGSIWADTTHKTVYVCTDNTVGAAVWVQIVVTAGGPGTAGAMGMPGFDGADGMDSLIPGPPGTSVAGPPGPPGFAMDGVDGQDGFGWPGPAGAAGTGGTADPVTTWALGD